MIMDDQIHHIFCPYFSSEDWHWAISACFPLQVKTEISVESKHQTLQGLAFPLQATAKRALQQLSLRHINYVQLVNHSSWNMIFFSSCPAFLHLKINTSILSRNAFDFCNCICTTGCIFQRLDTEKETIELVHSNPTETRDLPRRVPRDTPRYHFFLYKHSHEGDYLESIGMILIPVLS